MGIRWGATRTQDVSAGPYVASGLVWFSGTGTQTLTTSDHSKCLITNPVGSGKVVTILQLAFFANQAMFVSGSVNPTTALPTTAQSVNNAIFDGRTYTGLTTFKHEVSITPISGGITIGATLGVGAGTVTLIDGPFIIPPGNSFGLDAQSTGATKYASSMSWLET